MPFFNHPGRLLSSWASGVQAIFVPLRKKFKSRAIFYFPSNFFSWSIRFKIVCLFRLLRGLLLQRVEEVRGRLVGIVSNLRQGNQLIREAVGAAGLGIKPNLETNHHFTVKISSGLGDHNIVATIFLSLRTRTVQLKQQRWAGEDIFSVRFIKQKPLNRNWDASPRHQSKFKLDLKKSKMASAIKFRKSEICRLDQIKWSETASKQHAAMNRG